MPALKNQRQERFCQLIKQGIPPYRAYPMAGYNAHQGAPYRLCENVRVRRRLAEIGKNMSRKTAYTIEKALLHLEEDRALARAKDQPAAAIAATQLSAKLVGLLIDRKESGAPGDFANLQTTAEVVDAIRAELGTEAANLTLALLARSAGEGEASEPGLVETGPAPGDAVN